MLYFHKNVDTTCTGVLTEVICWLYRITS